MKIIITLLFLAFNAQANTTPTVTFEAQLTLQKQTTNAQIALQNQAIKNLQNQFEAANQYQSLRKDVLDSQENSINWWWTVIGIFLTIFALIIPIVLFIVNKQYKESIKEKIKEFKRLNKDAESELMNIKEHTQTAREGADKVTKLHRETTESIDNPKASLTPKMLKEVDKFGTKLEKMIVEARQLQKDKRIEEAITLWHEIVGIAKYTNNKEQQGNGYFYLGYLYRELGGDDNLERAIFACQKSIDINAYDSNTYANLFEIWLVQNQTFDPALVAQFKQKFGNNQTTMIIFDMLNLFKTINDTSSLNLSQQQDFEKNYVGKRFEGWTWDVIEQWIATKQPNAHLQSALDFFKTFD